MLSLQTIGIVSPGSMGHMVGQVLRSHGLRVVTCLQGRSERTRELAAKAQIENLPGYGDLVREADMVLSILVPAQARAAAEIVAAAYKQADTDLVYVDCNAIAPTTVQGIDALMTGAGMRFVDASIIGPPPYKPGVTRFYASGPHVDAFAALGDYGLDIRVMGDQIGQASAIKMCYAASTKGLIALRATLMTAAQALGVADALMGEFAISQPDTLARLKSITTVPRKARRFVGEMEEIASTFAAAGLSSKMPAGAAEMYRLIGETALADVAPEDPTPPPELAEALQILVDHLAPRDE